MKLSNIIIIKKTTKCDKSIVKCDVGTTQYEDRTIKCEKKNEGTTKCDKRTVICDVRTTQCEDETIKCEKKNKGTTKCGKKTVTYDVEIAQCEDETIKCDVLVTWYSRLSTSGYHPPQKMGYSRITLQNYYSSSYS